MSAVQNRATGERKSWSERVKAWLCGGKRRAATQRTVKLGVESLEARDVPSTVVNPLGGLHGTSSSPSQAASAPFHLNLSSITGLANPSPGLTYQQQLKANQQIATWWSHNVLIPLESQAVSLIPTYGFSPGLTNYLTQTLTPVVGQRSILDGTIPTKQQFDVAKANLIKGVNDPAFLANPAGHDFNVMVLGGMGNVAGMNAGPGSYQKIMNDSYIGLTSGYLPYQATMNYVQQHDVGPNGKVNLVGFGHDIVIGQGVMGNLALLQRIGG
jgi:hypothetical protein